MQQRPAGNNPDRPFQATECGSGASVLRHAHPKQPERFSSDRDGAINRLLNSFDTTYHRNLLTFADRLKRLKGTCDCVRARHAFNDKVCFFERFFSPSARAFPYPKQISFERLLFAPYRKNKRCTEWRQPPRIENFRNKLAHQTRKNSFDPLHRATPLFSRTRLLKSI